MVFQRKLFGLVVVLLFTLSFCKAKNVTVKIIGAIHCTDCISRQFSNSQASLGVDVLISCKYKNRGTKTQGNSGIDKEGKFNVTLSAEIKDNGYSIQGCLAKLQTASPTTPCPIQSPQTASVEIITADQNATQNWTTIVKFSPLTCQSAFFWPMPNFTNFPTLPPPQEYAPPPSEASPPVEPPLPPVEDLTPPPAPASEPSYFPQAPSLPPTLPPPTPAQPPAFQSPLNPPNPTTSPPLPICNTPPPPTLPPQAPPLNAPIPPPIPILPPIPPKTYLKPHFKAPIAPPAHVLSPPPPLPEQEKQAPPPSHIGISIPRAPPVPHLPATPQVPRKYFKAPKSKSKPPHSF